MEVLFNPIWFLVFWGIASVVIITSLERERFFLGNVLSIIGCVVIYQYINHYIPDALTLGNIAIFIGGYLIFGAAWSLFKWYRHCKEKLDDANYKIKQHPKDYDYIQSGLTVDLCASNNKGRICAWIAYWPWSCFWSLTRDTIHTIFDLLNGLYNKISKSALNKLEKPVITKE